MSSYLDIYRKKARSTNCDNSQVNSLIKNAIGKTIIYHRRRGCDIPCNLIISNAKEGLGTAKVYTFASDDLQVGDYFVWKDTHVFLVTNQEQNVALDDSIHKLFARECNIQFIYGTKDEWESNDTHTHDGVFIGKRSTAMVITTDLNTIAPMTDTNDNSVLIFSGASVKRFESLKIRDTQWKVMSWDSITAAPIVYATVEEVPVTLDIQEEDSVTPDTPIYKSGVTYEFPTEDFYFKSIDVQPKERLQDKVLITLPYNKNSISFQVKEGNEIKEMTIRIEG